MGMCLTRESQNFLSLDIENSSKYKLNVVWFIGDWGYNGEKLYIRYGHLGFYLDGGKKYKEIKGNFRGEGYTYLNEKILISFMGKIFYIFGKIIERLHNVILNYQLYKIFK